MLGCKHSRVGFLFGYGERQRILRSRYTQFVLPILKLVTIILHNGKRRRRFELVTTCRKGVSVQRVVRFDSNQIGLLTEQRLKGGVRIGYLVRQRVRDSRQAFPAIVFVAGLRRGCDAYGRIEWVFVIAYGRCYRTHRFVIHPDVYRITLRHERNCKVSVVVNRHEVLHGRIVIGFVAPFFDSITVFRYSHKLVYFAKVVGTGGR